MRWFVVAALASAACGSSAPAMREQIIEVRCSPATPRADDDPQAARLARELAQVDHELDTIDTALVAETARGMTHAEAVVIAAERQRLAGRTVEQRTANEPYLLARIAAQYATARLELAELERHLGAKNPELVAAVESVQALAGEYERQRDLEITHARAWGLGLAKLGARATVEQVATARVRALVDVGAEITRDGLVPSDAPPALVAASLQVRELKRRRAALGHDVGPKHPELVEVNQRLAAAREALQQAFADALQQPATAANAPRREIAMVAHRATLALRAQQLRRELASRRR